MQPKTIVAGNLEVAFLDYGAPDGWPCVMCHGFPYDVHAYSEVGPLLAKIGARVVVPYLRGFGPTRFCRADTPRSGEQAALGADLLALLDALDIQKAVVGGYDWGGRAACIVSALWPQRVAALISANSYNIQDIARSSEPSDPEQESALWYQFYFHSERGRRGLEQNRRAIARLLWRQWSPTWSFSDVSFQRTMPALDNPDFVDVTIHSYRHRFGLVAGDPMLTAIEARLADQPSIHVPTITIDGDTNGLWKSTAHHAKMFTGPHEHRVFENVGHNIPQESPREWVKAVLDAKAMAGSHGNNPSASFGD